MKKIIAIVTALILICGLYVHSYAYEAKEHDKYMTKVLFGTEDFSFKDDNASEANLLLEYASYLAIDQFNGYGEDKLNTLLDKKVKNLPSFDEIDFTDNSHHRSHTHRGWNFVYPDKKDNERWPLRKNILRSTANKLFDFGFMNEFMGKYCDKCDSFCKLIYYIHILGDHIAQKSYKTEDLMITFAKGNTTVDDPDIIDEINDASKRLFEDQKDTRTYMSYMSELDVIGLEARNLQQDKGGINTDEKFKEYQNYENEVMDILSAYVPLLLENEKFFKEVFY